ncbi:hypothetical protein M422DRAFT_242237 [Sphaerobolus stellatus SS14]|nr:hypothetical protein M422DRAFT_242237 [Sphaerobolus stellatus SS14]
MPLSPEQDRLRAQRRQQDNQYQEQHRQNAAQRRARLNDMNCSSAEDRRIRQLSENIQRQCQERSASIESRRTPTPINTQIPWWIAVRGRLQISARNLSVWNYPSRQAPSGSDSARDSPSTHSSTPMAGEWEVWLETMVAWWRIYAHIVIAHE